MIWETREKNNNTRYGRSERYDGDDQKNYIGEGEEGVKEEDEGGGGKEEEKEEEDIRKIFNSFIWIL